MLYLTMFKIALASLVTTFLLVIIAHSLNIDDNDIIETIGGLIIVVSLVTSFLAAWMWVFNI